MATFSRKPKFQDQALSELAQMFASPELIPDDPTPGTGLLDGPRLDFSIASLALVDDYLDQMRQRDLEDEAYGKVVLRCGAYVGEVILRNAKDKTYHWLDYNEALRMYKGISAFGENNLGSVAILWDGADGLTFPLGKIMKFLENGREDSVQFFATVMIEKGA